MSPPARRDGAGRGPGGGAAIVFAVAVLVVFGLLRTGYFYFGELAEGKSARALPVLVNELTAAVSTIVVFLLLIPFVRRWPLTRVRAELRVRLPLHLLALVAASAFMTTFMWLSRSATYPVLGLPPYDYGKLLLRYPMEGFNHVLTYVLLVGAIQFWLAQQEAREREVREARLAARWSEARLQSLQAQLHPHFLFNTLNTISSAMYRSPEDADRVLSLLSDLLRLQLAASGQRVSIEEELEALRLYLEIMEARFTDRLTWSISVDDDARGAEVPGFLLQPIVENAIRHGVARRADAGRVDIRVARAGDRLRITVDDDGPGPPSGMTPTAAGLAPTAAGLAPTAASAGPIPAGLATTGAGRDDGAPPGARGIGGLGIPNTRERLRHLYDAAASFRLAPREPRGARATVEIPFRPAPAVAGRTREGAAVAGESA